ncbi:glycosyltransferase family 4 protein [Alphaproteobacteria bacterium]|nr:glycosyltransferase family 4 protein [Alphaproteobacteria bacterium]MDC1023071.1 glycosyltransferase family 4 protein [Alphaproteobacteria bacterium]
MKILFISPLPPPITGHSYISGLLCNQLRVSNSVVEIDLSKDSLHDGSFSFSRVLSVFSILVKIFNNRNEFDRFYLTLSQTLLGNIKDILILLILRKQLFKGVVHLHGGVLKKNLFDKCYILKKINQYFLGRLRRIVVSGKSHVNTFDGFDAKISVIKNGVERSSFVSIKSMEQKFKKKKLTVLYLGGMHASKGIFSLVEAIKLLPDKLKKEVEFIFAGRFFVSSLRNDFLNRIKGCSSIRYIGEVNESDKQKLFKRAQVFCLPSLNNEGQPMAILEAYAGGCVVIASDQPGILDVFDDKNNGVKIFPTSISIKNALEMTLNKKRSLLQDIASLNRHIAMKEYTIERFSNDVQNVLK